ncbi:MAG: CHAT domain-containing protein [Chloroflexales bacterium]
MATIVTTYNLEIRLRFLGEDRYSADMQLDNPASAAEVELVSDVVITLDHVILRAAWPDLSYYGIQLSLMLFADPRMRAGWARAIGHAEGGGATLRLRLRLDGSDPLLHSIYWETLADPQSGNFIATDERVLLSRVLDSSEAAPVLRRSRATLRALAMIAAPIDLDRYKLSAITREREAGIIRIALSELKLEVIAGESPEHRATLAALVTAARDGYDIIYLVAHGRLVDGQPVLYFEDDAGRTAPVPGDAIADALSQLARRPILVVLASCMTAGDGASASLIALGPKLLKAGVPAVLAMHGSISMIAVARMMPVFLREIQREGLIDRALASARASVRDLNDWWRPVLYSRLRDGCIWEEQPASIVQPSAVGIVTCTNPFGQVGRISDTDSLFGRDDLLRRIFEELSKGVSISLVGERQVGKSSLLEQIRRLGPARLHLPAETFIYLNMQLVDDERDFFEALCYEMSMDPSLRGSRLARALRGKQFVVCLDEVEKMTNATAFSGAEREQLRGLAEGGAPLRLVIASNSSLERLFPDSEGKTSPLANICQKIDVLPFTPTTIRSFLFSRLEGSGVSFSEEQIAALIRQSGGNPARLQRTARELFEQHRDTWR